jgi:hypothetical protein
MADLALPLTLLVLAVVAVLLFTAFRRPSQAIGAHWDAATELRDGVTVVLVRHLAGGRELGRQVIAELAADLPDWDSRYHEAMAEARARVAALESEAG